LKQLYPLHKISVSIIFLLFSVTALAGDPYRISAGAGEAGTGYVCVMKSGFWSSFHNQAMLAFNRSVSTGINYENRFNINELGTRSVGLIIPSGKASLGALYSHFGYSDFVRQSAGLACGMSLNKKIAAGLQIDCFSERTTSEYNSKQAITFEAGMVITPSENVNLGIHLFNPVPNSIRKNYLPSSLRIGAGVNLSRILFAGAEAEMNTGNNLIFRTGFEYETAKRMWLRGGFCTENTSFSFGLGYLIEFVKIDIGFISHEKLGVTSSASLIFKIR
jgi:hypothetical protein